MHPEFQRLLQEATLLTRRGDLQAATLAIRQALHRQPASEAAPGEVIDVPTREVPDAESGTWSILRDLQPGRAGDADPLPGTDAPPVAAAATGSASFVPGRHGGPRLAGRDYKLFVPPGAGSRPMPLVLMLHGCTQDPDDFAAGTRMNELAQARGFFVLYAAQSEHANPQRCWNWFKAYHQGRGRGEPALLAGMVRELMGRHAIDSDRVFVAGLSAGGAMAALVAAAYPELFAAAGVHSGLAPGVAQDVQSAFEAMRKGPKRKPRALPVPTIVFHGDADKTVHPANGRPFVEATEDDAAAPEVQVLRADGRRRATREVRRDTAGTIIAEHWLVHGLPHAWSGGSARGSYTDPAGPDASAEMLRFFLEHPRRPG